MEQCNCICSGYLLHGLQQKHDLFHCSCLTNGVFFAKCSGRTDTPTEKPQLSLSDIKSIPSLIQLLVLFQLLMTINAGENIMLRGFRIVFTALRQSEPTPFSKKKLASGPKLLSFLTCTGTTGSDLLLGDYVNSGVNVTICHVAQNYHAVQ